MNKKFPQLYEQSTTGKTKHWSIVVESRTNGAAIEVKYGVGDSKVRLSESVITRGKNIGKANETSPFEQACLEAEATWKKKIDSGYTQNEANISKEVLLPMLAMKFQERKHDIVYPAYVQPKLDGVRCLAVKQDDETIKYYSRMGKEFTTLGHLTAELLDAMEIGQVLDGEIYSHDYTFQEAISFIKKARPQSSSLNYYVFDLVDTKAPFESRHRELRNIFELISFKSKIKLLQTIKIDDEPAVGSHHNAFVKAGYEGIIVRNTNGMYALKNRSKDLQKYKEFKDEEFEIIGGQPSTGTEVDCVIFTVKNKNGQTFAVRPRGSFEQRKQWMGNIKHLIGKSLTVRFQELTDDGLPRFPVGIGIRDYES
jgi:DNA ligase-1